MTTYSKTGPFSAGVAPGISHTFLNSLEDSLALAHTELHAHEAASAPHSGHETPTGAQDKVNSHAALTSPHSAASEATASRLVIRDANGRAKFANPSVDSHAATKSYVDSEVSGLGATKADVDHTHLTRKAVTMAVAGALAVGDSVLDFPLVAFEAMTLAEVIVQVDTAPSGGPVTVNIAYTDADGITGRTDLFTSGNRPSIPDGSKQATASTFNVASVAKLKRLHLDVDAANGAADLMLYLVYKAASETEA